MVPDLSGARRLLCIQPHYDDNDLGAGGTIAALAHFLQHQATSKLARARLSRDEAPTRSSKVPGSTTQVESSGS